MRCTYGVPTARFNGSHMVDYHSIRISKQHFLTSKKAVGSQTVYHLVFTDTPEMEVMSCQSFAEPGKEDVVLCYERADFEGRTVGGESMQELVSRRLGKIVTLQSDRLRRRIPD